MHRMTIAGVALRADGTLPPLGGCDPNGDAGLREKLRRVEEQINQARDERAEAVKERDVAKEAYAGTDDLSTDSDEFKAAEQAVAKVGTIDDNLAALAATQVGILKMLGQQDSPNGNGTPPHGARARGRQALEDLERAGESWEASKLFADEETRAALAHAATSKNRMGGIQLGEIIDRDTFVADIAGTPNMRRGEYAGIVPQLRRRIRLLDLLPTGTTDGNTVPYTQESGTFTAAETVEGGIKPESGVTFTDATAPVQTIAAWQKIRKQVLADVPAMQSIIDGRLRYSVERRLEDEILAGNGVDPNLLGILNTTGIGTTAFVAGTLIADQVLKGLTSVMLADAEPTGIVLHPTDWQTTIMAKAGDGHYYSGGPFSTTPQVLWGVPLVSSRVIPQGTALVGDWEIGAQLFIREGVNVLISDSDQDDFVRNRATLLAEMRAALAVWRPAAFNSVALQ